tara:strand:+ start:682 stop:1080 length:399 start_codon:yes stop_codon:yes gene_type:complete
MEDKNSSRKYDSYFRKKLLEKVNSIKDKKVLLSILKIVKNEDENGYSQNKSGIFFNLNKLSDDSIKSIDNLVEKYNLSNESETNDESLSDKIIYKQYSDADNLDQYDNLGPRLSNQEKSILKKFSKNLNENN